MNKLSSHLLLSFLAIVLVACGQQAGESPTARADTIYTNGKIYTVNEAQSWAEALAIKDGAFVVVGSAVMRVEASKEGKLETNGGTISVCGTSLMPV